MKLAEGECHRAIRRGGLMIEIVVHVAGHKQIEPPVAIVVSPGRAVRPVPQRDTGLFGNIAKRPVVIVVVEAVLAEVADEDIGPAVVVVVADCCAESPAVVGYACFRGDIGKRTVVVVVEQGCMRWLSLSAHSIVGRAVDEVDIEPAIVVVVDETHARSIRLENVFLLARAHDVLPRGQARRLAGILEYDRSMVDKTARGDGPLLVVIDRRKGSG